MFGNIAGYILIKCDAKCDYVAMLNAKEWQGKTVRALELNDNTNTALVINSEANAMDMIDYDDIKAKFKCSEFNDVLVPPDNDLITNMMESSMRMTRKGGYDGVVKSMVIAASLHKEEFNDDFLFQKQ